MVSGSCACTSIGKSEVGRQVPADLPPRLAGVVAAHDVPVLLHEQHARARPVHRDAVHAVAHLGRRVGDLLGPEAAVHRPPRLAGVVAPERARRRDGDEDPLGMARIDQDRVQAHPAGTRLPGGRRGVLAQSGQLLPGLAAVDRAEQGGVLDPGVDRVRIGQRRFEMPDARELPGVRRAVVPQVRAGDAVVHELVPHRLPRRAPVVGALDQLPEPAAGLRRIQPIRVRGRSLEVVDLPAPEVGATDVPPLARAVRRQHERPLARTNQDPYPAHPSLLPGLRARRSGRTWLVFSPYGRTGRLEIDIPGEKGAGASASVLGSPELLSGVHSLSTTVGV